MERRSAERSAENESIFRDANEALRAKRDELELVDGATPFFCECENEACRDLVFLSLDEYERVRAKSNRFFIVPGHDVTHSTIAEEHERYVVTEKVGEAGELAEEADPRRQAEV